MRSETGTWPAVNVCEEHVLPSVRLLVFLHCFPSSSASSTLALKVSFYSRGWSEIIPFRIPLWIMLFAAQTFIATPSSISCSVESSRVEAGRSLPPWDTWNNQLVPPSSTPRGSSNYYPLCAFDGKLRLSRLKLILTDIKLRFLKKQH